MTLDECEGVLRSALVVVATAYVSLLVAEAPWYAYVPTTIAAVPVGVAFVRYVTSDGGPKES